MALQKTKKTEKINTKSELLIFLTPKEVLLYVATVAIASTEEERKDEEHEGTRESAVVASPVVRAVTGSCMCPWHLPLHPRNVLLPMGMLPVCVRLSVHESKWDFVGDQTVSAHLWSQQGVKGLGLTLSSLFSSKKPPFPFLLFLRSHLKTNEETLGFTTHRHWGALFVPYFVSYPFFRDTHSACLFFSPF